MVNGRVEGGLVTILLDYIELAWEKIDYRFPLSFTNSALKNFFFFVVAGCLRRMVNSLGLGPQGGSQSWLRREGTSFIIPTLGSFLPGLTSLVSGDGDERVALSLKVNFATMTRVEGGRHDFVHISRKPTHLRLACKVEGL